jgi:YcaO-like protein with predicted kinase domain
MEVLSQRPNSELVVTGPRRRLPMAQAVKKAEAVARTIGVTRVAEIGRFVDRGVHVCQATRPKVLDHYTTGMNTGAQGKGYDIQQAYVSAVMETAESYCAETRSIDLIRGSYDALSKLHVIAEPNQFVPTGYDSTIDPGEPLMWTRALHVGLRTEVLIPADVVYLFHLPRTYQCAQRFYRSSIGLGAGFDTYTAALKALHEVFEHHYRAHFLALGTGGTTVEGFLEDGLIASLIRKHSPEFRKRTHVQFCAATIPGATQNMPLVVCFMGDERHFYPGWGFDLDPVKAIRSAHTEAFQGWATCISGTRENMPTPDDRQGRSPGEPVDLGRVASAWPDRPTLSMTEFQRRFAHVRTNGDDLASLLRVLKRNGFSDVYFANLSRQGIECSVVRAVVPRMAVDAAPPSRSSDICHDDIVRRQFLIEGP